MGIKSFFPNDPIDTLRTLVSFPFNRVTSTMTFTILVALLTHDAQMLLRHPLYFKDYQVATSNSDFNWLATLIYENPQAFRLATTPPLSTSLPIPPPTPTIAALSAEDCNTIFSQPRYLKLENSNRALEHLALNGSQLPITSLMDTATGRAYPPSPHQPALHFGPPHRSPPSVPILVGARQPVTGAKTTISHRPPSRSPSSLTPPGRVVLAAMYDTDAAQQTLDDALLAGAAPTTIAALQASVYGHQIKEKVLEDNMDPTHTVAAMDFYSLSPEA
jgi:hypothetical protein